MILSTSAWASVSMPAMSAAFSWSIDSIDTCTFFKYILLLISRKRKKWSEHHNFIPIAVFTISLIPGLPGLSPVLSGISTISGKLTVNRYLLTIGRIISAIRSVMIIVLV